MRWNIDPQVRENSFDYFEKTLIADNGFREYDVRWLVGKEINPNGFVVLGRAYGTMMQEFLKEKKVVVGHDFRSYSQDLCRSLVLGLLSTGVHVIDVGLTLTPDADTSAGIPLYDGIPVDLVSDGMIAFAHGPSGTATTPGEFCADRTASSTAPAAVLTLMISPSLTRRRAMSPSSRMAVEHSFWYSSVSLPSSRASPCRAVLTVTRVHFIGGARIRNAM